MNSSITLLACTFILGFLLLYSFLNRKVKPLPPGPKPWPIVGNLPHLGPKPHQSMAALARVHGPLIHLKMGFVHVVVAASASVAEQFLNLHDANFSSRPPNSGAKYVAYNYQDLVFAPYGPRWRMLRKICALHLFSTKALTDFTQVRQEVTQHEALWNGAYIAELVRHPEILAQAQKEVRIWPNYHSSKRSSSEWILDSKGFLAIQMCVSA